MDKRHYISMREKDGYGPPGLLRELRDEIKELGLIIPGAVRKWAKGKGDAELAKVTEIQARVIEKIKRLELDYERLHQQDRKDRMHHKEQMIALDTDRIRAKAEALRAISEATKNLRDVGIEIQMEVVERVAGSLGAGVNDGGERELPGEPTE